MGMRYLEPPGTDPAFNLAMEQYAFDRLSRDDGYFMLWQNDNAVIIGKNQNTVEEIDQAYTDAHQIRVVRRLSGGGAVYHDLGNLNFTFIADAKDLSQLNFRLFCEPVARVLRALGVNAEVNGRNDITIDGKKFSGNSQYIRGGRVMHHGTILFDSDLEVVSKALRVPPDKIESKGVKSVRSRMTNVREHLREDVSLGRFKELLLHSIFGAGEIPRYELTAGDLEQIEEIRRGRYANWDWNYGASPRYTQSKRSRIEGCGTVEARLCVENGVVTAAAFYGDFFGIRDACELASALVGCRAARADYERALSPFAVEEYFYGLDRQRLLELL